MWRSVRASAEGVFGVQSRQFSSSSVAGRIYAHVVRRRVKQVKPVEIGDPNINALHKRAKEIPQYPYGEATLYKQSNRGLYGGRMIQFGNKVSDFGNRNMRTFKPNVHWNKLWSEALNKQINIRVVASVLRTITKEGGIDNYLIKDKPARIKELGPLGWKLRYQVLKKLEKKEAQDKTRPKPVRVIENSTSEVSAVDSESASEAAAASAKSVPIYAEYTSQTNEGSTYLITVGRINLLKRLFGQLRAQGSQDAQSYKHFISLYKDLPMHDTLQKLEATGYDLTLVSYQP
ncbi:mitochondrial 54S ribosomal protein YmL24/YmL14 [Sugiyamaella lignohabitans]|uniref:Large ribosomal subunit protein bL28m n=1 Tax=Sugiyamaella lignohabitans TaxID=796027 RepID=A0A167EPJ2_9ASCO|nr:mitochondrial 54S ribosomal protein YmL24/YmL14 [Sugiyamaella lignohabitans]ANB14313.1 mitochondrial 54S ribosomal protein YmL24/YmL14 [Sugiyamaella lignohabitans]